MKKVIFHMKRFAYHKMMDVLYYWIVISKKFNMSAIRMIIIGPRFKKKAARRAYVLPGSGKFLIFLHIVITPIQVYFSQKSFLFQ